jgi:hypothetical protein
MLVVLLPVIVRALSVARVRAHFLLRPCAIETADGGAYLVNNRDGMLNYSQVIHFDHQE